VFARAPGQPLRSTSLQQVLRGVNNADGDQWIDSLGRPIMFAGFRRAFCEWAAEIAHYPLFLAEIALGMRDSHSTTREGNLNRQREVLEAWAEYCCGGLGPGVEGACIVVDTD
jgi:hypothetical protein